MDVLLHLLRLALDAAPPIVHASSRASLTAGAGTAPRRRAPPLLLTLVAQRLAKRVPDAEPLPAEDRPRVSALLHRVCKEFDQRQTAQWAAAAIVEHAMPDKAPDAQAAQAMAMQAMQQDQQAQQSTQTVSLPASQLMGGPSASNANSNANANAHGAFSRFRGGGDNKDLAAATRDLASLVDSCLRLQSLQSAAGVCWSLHEFVSDHPKDGLASAVQDRAFEWVAAGESAGNSDLMSAAATALVGRPGLTDPAELVHLAVRLLMAHGGAADVVRVVLDVMCHLRTKATIKFHQAWWWDEGASRVTVERLDVLRTVMRDHRNTASVVVRCTQVLRRVLTSCPTVLGRLSSSSEDHATLTAFTARVTTEFCSIAPAAAAQLAEQNNHAVQTAGGAGTGTNDGGSLASQAQASSPPQRQQRTVAPLQMHNVQRPIAQQRRPPRPLNGRNTHGAAVKGEVSPDLMLRGLVLSGESMLQFAFGLSRLGRRGDRRSVVTRLGARDVQLWAPPKKPLGYVVAAIRFAQAMVAAGCEATHTTDVLHLMPLEVEGALAERENATQGAFAVLRSTAAKDLALLPRGRTQATALDVLCALWLRAWGHSKPDFVAHIVEKLVGAFEEGTMPVQPRIEMNETKGSDSEDAAASSSQALAADREVAVSSLVVLASEWSANQPSPASDSANESPVPGAPPPGDVAREAQAAAVRVDPAVVHACMTAAQVLQAAATPVDEGQ